MNPIQDNLLLAAIFSFFGFAIVGWVVKDDPMSMSGFGLVGAATVYVIGYLLARVAAEAEIQQTLTKEQERQAAEVAGKSAETGNDAGTGPAVKAAGQGMNLSDAAGKARQKTQPNTDPQWASGEPGSAQAMVNHGQNDNPVHMDEESTGE